MIGGLTHSDHYTIPIESLQNQYITPVQSGRVVPICITFVAPTSSNSENQMEKRVDNDMKTGIIRGSIGCGVSQNQGTIFGGPNNKD